MTEKEITEGEGVWKKLDSEYDPNRPKPTLEEFKKELFEFFNTPEMKAATEAHEAFLKKIDPYLHMTKEEMEEAIPNGYYELNSNGWVMGTGKGGFIQVILEVQKQLK